MICKYRFKLHQIFNNFIVVCLLMITPDVLLASNYPIKSDDKYFNLEEYLGHSVIYPKILARQDLNPIIMSDGNNVIIDYFNNNQIQSFRAVIRDVITRDNLGHISKVKFYGSTNTTLSNEEKLSNYIDSVADFLSTARTIIFSYDFKKNFDAEKIAKDDFAKMDKYFTLLKKFKVQGQSDSFDQLEQLKSLESWYNSSRIPEIISSSFGKKIAVYGDPVFNKTLAEISTVGHYGRGITSVDTDLIIAINKLGNLIDSHFNHSDPLGAVDELKPVYDALASYKKELQDIQDYVTNVNGDISEIKVKEFDGYVDAVKNVSGNPKISNIIKSIDAAGTVVSIGLGIYKNVSIVFDNQNEDYAIKRAKLEQLGEYYRDIDIIKNAIDLEKNYLDDVRDSSFNKYIDYVQNNTLEFTKDAISLGMDISSLTNLFIKNKTFEKFLGKSGKVFGVAFNLSDIYQTRENFKAQGARILASHILSSIKDDTGLDDEFTMWSALFGKYAGKQLITLYYWTPGYDAMEDVSSIWMKINITSDLILSANNPFSFITKSANYLQNIVGTSARDGICGLVDLCVTYDNYIESYARFSNLYDIEFRKIFGVVSDNKFHLNKYQLLSNIVVSKHNIFSSILINEESIFNSITTNNNKKDLYFNYKEYGEGNHIVGIRLINVNSSREDLTVDIAYQEDSSLLLRETATFHDSFQPLRRNLKNVNFKRYPFSDIRLVINNQFLNEDYALQLNFKDKNSFQLNLAEIDAFSKKLSISNISQKPLNVDEVIRKNSEYTFLSNILPSRDKKSIDVIQKDKPWSLVDFSDDGSYINVFYGKDFGEIHHTVIDTLTNKTTDIYFPVIDYKINKSIVNENIINSAVFYETFKDPINSKYIDKVYEYIERKLKSDGVTENINYATGSYLDNAIYNLAIPTTEPSMLVVLSKDAFFNENTREITSPKGSEIRLSFDKYFTAKEGFINAGALSQAITIKWATAANRDEFFSEPASWDSTTLQLVFNSPTNEDFILVGVEYPTETGTDLVPFPAKINANIINSTNPVAISVGDGYSVALQSDGTLLAWGGNYQGQLGNGTTVSNNTPNLVVDEANTPINNIRAIVSKGTHNLAVTTNGELLAWGNNENGQLGNGSTVNQLHPEYVVDNENNKVTGIKTVATGYGHTVALKTDGTLLAWGRNRLGQLGDGTEVSRLMPVVVKGADNQPVTGIRSIVAGPSSSLALKADGSILAWGKWDGTQEDYDRVVNSIVPLEMLDSSGAIIRGIKEIAASGDRIYALDADNNIVTWYRVSTGRATPIVLVDSSGGPIADIKSIVAGSPLFALKNNGEWLTLQGTGRIFTGSRYEVVPALLVDSQNTPISDIQSIATGSYSHSLALKANGSVLAWGGNGSGQLGDGSTIDQVSPVAVIDQNDVPINLYNSGTTTSLDSVALAAGGGSSFALKPDGTWLAWGANYDGKLSVGSNPEEFMYPAPPMTVLDGLGNDLTGVQIISTGMSHSIGLKEDGSLLAWGSNGLGQLGNGTTNPSLSPVEVFDSQNNKVTGVQSVVVSGERNLAVRVDGTLLTWGWDGRSSLNYEFGTPGFNSTAQIILDGNGQAITGVQNVFSFISQYGDHTIEYVLKDNLLFTLEPNFVQTGIDEFGYGVFVEQGNKLVPVMNGRNLDGDPEGIALSGVKSVGMIVENFSEEKIVFLMADGSLVKWAEWFYDFNSGWRREVESIVDGVGSSVTGVKSISSSGRSLIALKEDGTVLALGANSQGELGDNTTINRSNAVNVVDVNGSAIAGVQALATSYGHTIALKDDGTVLTWGNNYDGMLSVYPLYDQIIPYATSVMVYDDEASDPYGYGEPVYKSLNLGSSVEVEEVTVGWVSEFPEENTILTTSFLKTWKFTQDISAFSVSIISSTYNNVGLISVVADQVNVELTPNMANAENRIDLQLTDNNGNIVKVDNSDIFWSVTKTNHAPQLVNDQVTQMVGGIEDTLALTIETFDVDNDAVVLSVVDTDGGNVSFTGNRLYASFADNQTIHNIKIALDDSKESVTVDIPVLRFDSNTIKTFYSDVTENHLYYEDIAFATLVRAVWGQADLKNNQRRKFKPDNNASWAEALKMVVKSAAIANKIELPDSEFYLQTFPQWAMPYYTFAREQGAINFKKDDLSITYPSREEIAMLIVRTLGLDQKLEDFPQLTLEFSDKALFTDAVMDRYAQVARIYGLFMTNGVANPQAKVTRGELAQVISRIFMMPSANIFSIDGVEYGDTFEIEPLINKKAQIINDAFQLVDSSGDLTVEYAINFQKITDAPEHNSVVFIVDSSTLNVGSNTVIALIDNHGVRDFITKEINVSFTDNDFDGVQDATDVWADDYRYQYDINQNSIPDIMDSFYVLSGKTVEDSVSMGHLTIPITELISSGGFVCPQDAVVAYDPNTGEFQEYTGLCDVPAAWVVFPGIPTIAPVTGTFNSRVAVTLDSELSTTIYYTVDGSTPDTLSAVYNTPLLLENSATVKMLVISADGKASPIISESYTVLNKNVWSPIPGLSWQYQLQGVLDQSVSARVYDVDLIDTPHETIETLKANGSRVICYFNAGAWENWRSDATDYPEFVKGNAVDGFADEQWLDIREVDAISPLMQARFDLAVTKGCDAVEPDNVDAFSHNTGFPLSAADQINYNLWLSNQANARGLSIGLKNDLAQIPSLEPFFDWALNEQCFEFNECGALQPFITANKAVFGVEYKTAVNTPDTANICSISEANQYSWIIKRPELDAWVDACADYRAFIDEDNDGVIDNEDNCLSADNLMQRDTDNDGFGNRCDTDLNNDGVTNFADFAGFRQKFNSADPDADFNGDGVVNFADFAVFRSLFNSQPGPAAGH